MAADGRTLPHEAQARPGGRLSFPDLIGRALLATLLILMAYAHFRLWRDTGRISGLGLVLQESVVATLLIVRRRARESMNTPAAWLATLVGGLGLTLLRPVDRGLFGAGAAFGLIEFALALASIFALLTLGRSFGLVAANRGIQTGGPYRWVRHPIYALYLLTTLAYLGENPSAWNVAVVAIQVAAQIVRISMEEAVLSRDPVYRAYAGRVRYRLIPGVF